MNKPIKFMVTAVIIAFFGGFASAQISSGGTYTVNQRVVASGGGTSAEVSNTYKVEGTIGQAIAGSSQTSRNYSIQNGFWISALLAPTAAEVTISGRVVGTGNEGLRNIAVTLSGGNLFVPRRTRTGTFGNFTFDDVAAGQTYIIKIENRKYGFAQEMQVISVMDSVTDLIFQASWEN